MKNIIETKNLTKYYSRGKVLGIKNVNLKIEEGEIFGFLGPNGAGKSTTIRLLLDLIRPTSGSAKVFGLDVNKETTEIKKDIGYLPGDTYLPEDMTGMECINYYKDFKKNVSKKYIDELIEKLDLDTKKRIKTYSKGNKQKLAIILAMMHKPKLLIFDEPTTSLDPLNQQTFYKLIQKMKEKGKLINTSYTKALDLFKSGIIFQQIIRAKSNSLGRASLKEENSKHHIEEFRRAMDGLVKEIKS